MSKVRGYIVLMAANGLAFGALFGNSPVYAQEGALDGPGDVRRTGRIEEVVVTAQKRAENIQDVPIAVSAITGADLDAKQILTVDDLQFHVPGLNFGTFLGQAQVNMRGHGAEDQTVGGDPSTAYFLDGAYQGRTFLVTQSFFDTERVEVLRGPQGTLFGRNTTGGAINVIANKPHDEFEGHGDVTLGNYAAMRARAAVNIPLGDTVALRVSGAMDRHDGWLKNITRDEYLEDADTRSVRAILRYAPGPDLEVLLSGYRYDAYGSGPIRQAPTDQSAITGGSPEPRDFRVTRQDAVQKQHLEVRGAALEVNYDLNESLQLKSLTSYFENLADYLQDTDQSDRPLQFSQRIDNAEQHSQEFQLTSSFNGPFNFVVGLFAYHEDARVRLNPETTLRATLDSNGEIIGYTSTVLDNRVLTTSFAAYGQATYDFSESLSGTFGARFSRDEKEAKGQPIGGGDTRASDSWSAFTPRFGLDYRFNDDVMVYLTIAQGWKGGSMNIVPVFSSYDPETVWSYEVGLKSQLLDQRVLFNAAVFYDKLKDQQFIRALPDEKLGFVVDNAGKSTVYGAEIESRAHITPDLSFDVTASYLHARFDEFLTQNPGTLSDEVISLEGYTLPRSPTFTGTAGVDYAFHMGNGSSITARVQYRYTTKSYFQQFNDLLDYGHQDAYGKADIYLTYETPARNWSVQAYVKNVTDKDTVANGWRSQTMFPELGNTAFWYAAPPRTYGLTLSYSFSG